MQTKVVSIDGINFIVPEAIDLPFKTLDECPPCCGPGHGMLEKVIPETLLGLRISIACYIHDKWWDMAEPSWSDFHHANSSMLVNINEIIKQRPSRIPFVDTLRKGKASTAFILVTVCPGPQIFWSYKKGGTIMLKNISVIPTVQRLCRLGHYRIEDDKMVLADHNNKDRLENIKMDIINLCAKHNIDIDAGNVFEQQEKYGIVCTAYLPKAGENK